MTALIAAEQSGKIGRITFNRPKAMNALTPEMMAEVTGALGEFERNPEVRVVVFTGEGRAFSAGGDMKFLEELTGMTPAEIKRAVYARFVEGVRRIKFCSKPTIAAVNGPAVGAGCEIALACDFRIAAEEAVFSESWIRLGVIPALGGMFLLPQIVGLAKATEMIMLGTHVGGVEAERIGLAHKAVPRDRLEAETLELANRLAEGPALAYGVVKEGLRRGMESNLAAEWEFNVYAQAMLLKSQDFAEGVRAFREKRPPNFQGK